MVGGGAGGLTHRRPFPISSPRRARWSWRSTICSGSRSTHWLARPRRAGILSDRVGWPRCGGSGGGWRYLLLSAQWGMGFRPHFLNVPDRGGRHRHFRIADGCFGRLCTRPAGGRRSGGSPCGSGDQGRCPGGYGLLSPPVDDGGEDRQRFGSDSRSYAFDIGMVVKVRTLANGLQAGAYFYRLRIGEFAQVRRLMLLQ